MFDSIPPFAFVIDTEEYAGNFERQLCAFITGVIGECGVGQEEANLFLQSQGLPKLHPFQDCVTEVADEHGCHRPVAIWPTPGWYSSLSERRLHERDPETKCSPVYNSVAIFFSEEPSEEQIVLMRERAIAYCAEPQKFSGKFLPPRITITGFRLLALSLQEEVRLTLSA